MKEEVIQQEIDISHKVLTWWMKLWIESPMQHRLEGIEKHVKKLTVLYEMQKSLK